MLEPWCNCSLARTERDCVLRSRISRSSFAELWRFGNFRARSIAGKAAAGPLDTAALREPRLLWSIALRPARIRSRLGA